MIHCEHFSRVLTPFSGPPLLNNRILPLNHFIFSSLNDFYLSIYRQVFLYAWLKTLELEFKNCFEAIVHVYH